MMCVRGYSSVVRNAIKLDEKLKAASKQPPPDGLYDKSFFGKESHPSLSSLYHSQEYCSTSIPLVQLDYPNLPL